MCPWMASRFFSAARIRFSHNRATVGFDRKHNQEDVWQTNTSTKINGAFEITSKRRKGFPSETRVKKGQRIVHGDKELREKLGRNDLCPCGSGRRFQELLHEQRPLRWLGAETLFQRVNGSGPLLDSQFDPDQQPSRVIARPSCAR